MRAMNLLVAGCRVSEWFEARNPPNVIDTLTHTAGLIADLLYSYISLNQIFAAHRELV